MKENRADERNYNTISPSAKSLLFMKGHTNIPFARQTAEIAAYPKEFIPDFDKKDWSFWARVLHFENRYLSVNQLLEGINATNFIELSSGYSFRGLDITSKGKYFYIDTDLPEVIEAKRKIASSLIKNTDITGSLQIEALNALDEEKFRSIVSRLPQGEVVIINEGLLMYLRQSEKEKLGTIIASILKERGGYWITADIYLKNKAQKLNLEVDSETKEFFEQHQIEDNKFDSFDDAKIFFNNIGFEIIKEASIESSKLSSMKYLKRNSKLSQILHLAKVGKTQTTWLMRVSKS